MTVEHDPVVLRHRLRERLRRARGAASEPQIAVARAMDWSQSKLVRIESGENSISTNDLRMLLTHYGEDEKEIAEVVELARKSRLSSAFESYSKVFDSGFIDYMAFEASAATIRAYHPSLVLGPLQTEDYAKAVLSSRNRSKETIEAVWEARALRQELHERPDPPSMHFFLDESVIHRRVGGRTVMAKQLSHLLNMGKREHITLQLLPFSLGSYPGMDESFAVLEFDDPDIEGIVHLETSGRGTIQDDRVLAKYIDLSEELEKLAPSPEGSLALVEEASAKMANLE